jgi:hypothetical protein
VPEPPFVGTVLDDLVWGIRGCSRSALSDVERGRLPFELFDTSADCGRCSSGESVDVSRNASDAPLPRTRLWPPLLRANVTPRVEGAEFMCTVARVSKCGRLASRGFGQKSESGPGTIGHDTPRPRPVLLSREDASRMFQKADRSRRVARLTRQDLGYRGVVVIRFGQGGFGFNRGSCAGEHGVIQNWVFTNAPNRRHRRPGSHLCRATRKKRRLPLNDAKKTTPSSGPAEPKTAFQKGGGWPNG